ncbi:class I SAM-dependent methyltransferase [Flavobacterium sp. MAH-1]|uniref:Class I SAM-dependent methyltransferase n=1 Tax=Flavobacterium agri TaxID=2743471 RepID=A0A7Y8XZW7_9FLAO|nr:class I SAM-dependent methyltransferase [Flavobacterium agri]NUY80006.1 class I SAM-dependent methyltransferase [Flavobacterium agri]NYA70031.1 class I SAM-dependent methyltransferase [Flavobacterium agri]
MKKSALEIFNDNALKYQHKFMYLDLYDDSYDAFLSNLKPNAHVLEVGCGPGNITRYLLEKRPDLNLLATDFAPNMIELAQANNPKATCRLLDARRILDLNDRYDAIVCGFVAPYFSSEELETFIQNVSKISNNDGSLYLSVIEGEYSQSGWQHSSDGKSSTMVYLYSEADLEKMLSRNGFETKHVFRKAYAESTHLIFVAAISR